MSNCCSGCSVVVIGGRGGKDIGGTPAEHQRFTFEEGLLLLLFLGGGEGGGW